MNLFKNYKVRFSILALLGILQITCATITSKPYSDHFLYLVYPAYFALGFLSLDWKQAIRNIISAAIPWVSFIMLILLVIRFTNINLDYTYRIMNTSTTLWTLIAMFGLPAFLLGLGLRYMAVQVSKRLTLNL